MPTLSWLGDFAARTAARRVPYRILEPIETVGDPASENLLIQGDNLEALKTLLPIYAGRVKCIFIDPPYNTKSAFEHYDDNLEHSQWLSMMYPRLELLRELLSEDGSIWVTIDDNEGQYLKVLMDEVFGRQNFVATVIWQKVFTVKNSARHLSDMHDYVLVYAADSSRWQRNLLPRSEDLDATYTNPDNDPRGPWTTNALQARNYYAQGTFEVTGPTGKTFWPPPGTYWRVNADKLHELRSDGRVWFGAKGTAAPRIKKFLSEAKQGVVPSTLWMHTEAGQNAEAKEEIRALNTGDAEVFLTPKPERLLMRIINVSTSPGDLVLDSFLGSGTTTAVAHKMGRRWIGIEAGEHAATHCLPRLRKVIDGEQGGVSETVGWMGGGGFRFAKLGAKAFFDDGSLNADLKVRDLAAYIWFSETKRPHDVGQLKTSYLGAHNGVAYLLLYNGLLGDLRPEAGNVLTHKVWTGIRGLLPPDRRETVVYGQACRLSPARLKELGITFKQIPYDIGIR
jgi:adenine-specific DNA-methyltransferase